MVDLARLNICFVAGTLGQGGAERQLYYILQTLCRRGAQTRLLCLTHLVGVLLLQFRELLLVLARRCARLRVALLQFA